MTAQDSIRSEAARGIRVGRLERRALDDVALQAGCTLVDP
jgi:hypothetical protein